MNETDDIEKMEEKILGAALIVKYIGFAVFGLSLAVITIASLLAMTIPYTTEALIAGIVLIILGYVAETFLGQAEGSQ